MMTIPQNYDVRVAIQILRSAACLTSPYDKEVIIKLYSHLLRNNLKVQAGD